MSIATAIQNAQQKVADCYTAISNKGGTLPATQNLSNMPTAINSIQTGGTGYTELPSYQVVNGVVSRRSGALTGNEFSNITSIGDYGLCYVLYDCEELTGQLDLSSLTTIGAFGLNYAFFRCINLTGVDLSNLTTIGEDGMSYAFSSWSKLIYVNLPNLTNISNFGLNHAFYNCTGLTDVYFNSLTTTSFGLYTTQFKNMLFGTGTTVTHTLHFPSNLESTIQGLTGYPTFGGTSGYVVLAFDLPQTS